MGKAVIFMENEENHLRFSTFCYRVFAALSTAKKGYYSPYILSWQIFQIKIAVENVLKWVFDSLLI